jgi:hypothetical protein
MYCGTETSHRQRTRRNKATVKNPLIVRGGEASWQTTLGARAGLRGA